MCRRAASADLLARLYDPTDAQFHQFLSPAQFKERYAPTEEDVRKVVESLHAAEDSLHIMDDILSRGLKDETPAVKVRAGRGVGVVEAPRGILFHEYTYDKNGIVTQANCIIPTGQNLANIEADMRALVPQILDQGQEKVQMMMEMLVRAYDPCISCSTHFLNVKFV